MANRRISRNKNFASYVNAINQDVSALKTMNSGGSISAGAITGDSLAETVTLFSSSIQSSNYSAGGSGWKISGSGVAEFADVYVRGDINAETGTIGYWNISPVDSVRSIGPAKIVGTFLESSDIGVTDTEKEDGVYVAMFKSYFEDPRPLTNRFRVDGVATITVPGHTLAVGDYVQVEVVEDPTFDTHDAEAVVLEVTSDTVSYANPGVDFPIADVVTGITPSTLSTGTVQYFQEDTAGLYLNDYSNIEFDYGYLSNKGLAYVSAPEVNFIYNPSFEYAAELTERVGTVESWDTSGLSTTTSVELAEALDRGTYTAKIDAQSSYAVVHQWNTTPSANTNYLVGTIDYSEIHNYKYTTSNLPLHLSFDAFSLQSPASASVLANAATANATAILVTTTSNPAAAGIAADDYVYFSFTGHKYADNLDIENDKLTGFPSSSPSYGVAQVVSVRGTTPFNIVITNLVGSETGALTLTPKKNADGTDQTLRVFKASAGMLDLSEIKLNFGNATSDVSISSVLAADTAAYWAANLANKYYSVGSVSDHMRRIVDSGVDATTIQTLSSLYPVKIDSGLLHSLYKTTNLSGYQDKDPIEIKIPTWVYAVDPSTYLPIYSTGSPVKLSSVANATNYLVFDNFSVGTSGQSFYGDFDRDILVSGAAVTISNASPAVITSSAAHYLVPGQAVYLSTTGTLPTGLDVETKYYVYSVASPTTLTLTDSIDGDPVGTTLAGSGDHYLYLETSNIRYAWSNTETAPSSISTSTIGTAWIGLDLATASYGLDGVDSIGFSNKLFQRNLYAPANINTYMGYSPIDTTPNETVFTNKDYHYLNISSATIDTVDQVPTLFDGPSKRNTFTRSRSYINTLSSSHASGVEMAAVYEYLDENKLLIDVSEGIVKSSIIAYVDEFTRDPRIDISGTVNYLTADIVDSTLITGQRIRLTPGVDLSATSDGHNFQIGDSSGLNLRIDDNEIEALNNGAGSVLNLNVTGSGTVVFGGLLDSNDTYNNDITTTRHAMWISSAGVMGWASSSRTKKQDIVPADIDIDAVLSIEPKLFRYIKAVEQLEDDAPIEIGMIAEDLHDAGLTHFVDYTDEGVVQGIHYSTYVVALQAVVRDQAARITEIEKRLGI